MQCLHDNKAQDVKFGWNDELLVVDVMVLH